LVRDAIIDPTLTATNVASHGIGWASSLGRSLPNSESAAFDAAADLASRAQKGIDGRMDAAAAAVRNTPGYAVARKQADANNALPPDWRGLVSGAAGQILAPILPGMDATFADATQAVQNAGDILGGRSPEYTAADAANATADSTRASLDNFQADHPYLSIGAALVPLAASGGEVGAARLARSLGGESRLLAPVTRVVQPIAGLGDDLQANRGSGRQFPWPFGLFGSAWLASAHRSHSQQRIQPNVR
jgi:hypothetical protein